MAKLFNTANFETLKRSSSLLLNPQVVTARDEGGKAATARVEITVLDVNDHAPAFTGLPYTFRVPEGEVGTSRITTRFLNADNIDIDTMYIEHLASPSWLVL